MSIVRWEPFRDVLTLRDAMDRLFEESFVRPRAGWLGAPGLGRLDLDIYETKDDLVVKAAVPGVRPEDVDITVTGDTLTIKGETKEETETKKGNYYRKERRYGQFARSVSLPVAVKSDKAEARFKDGVLTLTLPKAEEAKPRVIKIKPERK